MELKGEAKEKQPECAGTYLPVPDLYWRGRPVSSVLTLMSENMIFQEISCGLCSNYDLDCDFSDDNDGDH